MAVRRSSFWGRLFLAAAFVAGFATIRDGAAVTLAWNANPEPDIAGYKLFWGETNATPTAIDVGNVTQAQVNDLVQGRTYRFYLTAYNTAGLESDASAAVIYTQPSPPPISVTTVAEYQRTDRFMQGAWKGAYGMEGAIAPYGGFTSANYVKVSAWGNYPLSWASSTTDGRALQKVSGADRFASAWRGTNDFYFYFNFTDTKAHQVSFYFVDWDRQNRSQLVEFFDDDTGEVMAVETISDFAEGVYSTWNLQGNVAMRVSRISGPNAVMSGVFFDKLANASANFLGVDSSTSGSWRGVYAAEGGLATPWGNFTPPSYVQISAYQNSGLVWAVSTSDTRGLQKATGTDRFAGAWRNASEFYFFLKFNDAAAHEVSFYFVDWERAGRQQKVDVFDQGTGNLLHSQTISNFGEGLYLTYNLKGNVRVRVSRIAGPDSVMSAILFDPAVNTAEFVEADTTTSGTWQGIYGAGGQSIAGESAALPAGTEVSFAGATPVVWEASTTDSTALQRSSGTGRIASAWAGPQQFTANLSFSDGGAHRVAFYFVDFEDAGREQVVEILDAETGAALDRSELSEFRSGIWLSYNVSGSVIVRVTSLTDAGAVMSGVFVD